mmetsp:Transcript_20251/g.49668  ORF Transcript_20251/g.49668 Transcript_20251/m.49668 type:complete len:474 (-) Transcript_20251:123-1544(-)
MKTSIEIPSTSKLVLLAFSLLLLVNTVQGQTTCASTADCEADVEYCSDGTCVQIGSCQKEVDCFNFENRNSFPTDECIGYLECKDTQCIKTCSDSICKPESNFGNIFCPSVMCDIKNCDGAVSCVNHNCDACDVFYFDSKGSQICDKFMTSDPVLQSCSSNADCHIDIGGGDDGNKTDDVTVLMALDAKSYCAGGTCAAPGTCSTDQDCVNPSNHYDIIECAGPILCQQGQCTRDCGTGSMCKEGSNQVYCLVDPCDVSGCPESTGCVADYCDGCNALHFDAAGNVLDECNEAAFTVPESCTQDTDCNSDRGLPTHYCSAGSCEPMGTCNSTSDCLNPSNEVNFVTCTGYHQCASDGQCGHVCSNDEHCCFVEAKCTDEEMEACPDAVTCVKDNCNDSGDHCGAGTGSFYFDSSGNSICAEVEESPTTAPTTLAPTGKPGLADGDELTDGAKMLGSTLSLMAIVIATIATMMV